MKRKQILVISDKFRGTLTAAQASRAIADGLRRVWDDCCEYLVLPMADGGEGTAALLPDQPVVESAQWIGHSCGDIVSEPVMQRSSAALGYAVNRMISGRGRAVVAIGGTVTADGGAGMLSALGARFYDRRHRLLTGLSPATLPLVCDIDLRPVQHLSRRIIALADVEASLTGPGLSALDFLAQKGASPDDASRIRLALNHLQQLAGGHSPYDGAGGGVGYALCSVLGCKGCLGAGYMLSELKVDWSRVALVVTGEGSIDSQSLGGKSVGTIIRHCDSRGIPVVAFGGRVSPEITDSRCVAVSPQGAVPEPAEAARLLREAAAAFAGSCNFDKLSVILRPQPTL